jgi:hypothetical protein
MMSHRTQITLTDDQYERLLDESARSGLPIAVLVHRAVDQSYVQTNRNELIAAINSSFGVWTNRDVDGEEYVERLRRGPARRVFDLRQSCSTPRR